MTTAARVRRAALMTAAMVFGVLPLSGSEARMAKIEDTGITPVYVQNYEELTCRACGETSLFWIYCEPEFAAGGRSLAEEGVVYSDDPRTDSVRLGTPETDESKSYTGFHWKMTMCLNCSAINGDLSPSDHAFWLNIFRLEACPADHTQEIRYEAVDGAHHQVTAVDTAVCRWCGESSESLDTALEDHTYTASVTDPTADAGGYTTYTCTLCGYSYRGDETPPLSQQGETDPDPTPDPTPDPIPDPVPDPVPDPAPDPLPELSPMPETLSHRAYIEGMPGGLFAPSKSMTRAEGAVMLARLMEESLPSAADGSFEDVPADAWYAEAVNRLAAAGVVRGRTARTFAPQAEITRAEFAALAARIFPTGGAQRDRAFPDVPASHWAAEEIGAAEALGWIQGYPDGAFRPDAPITRAEAVAVLNRVLGRQADRTYLEENLADLRTFPDVGPDYWAWYDVLEAANSHGAHMDGQEIWVSLF